MANRKLKRALAAMSKEKRDQMRAIVTSYATVDDLIEGMRPKVSAEDIAKVWEAVQERIAREGIVPDKVEGGVPGDVEGGVPGDVKEPTPPAAVGHLPRRTPEDVEAAGGGETADGGETEPPASA